MLWLLGKYPDGRKNGIFVLKGDETAFKCFFIK